MNFSDPKKTSVRINQAPGGNSQIVFGDSQPVQQQPTGKRGQYNNSSQISFGYEEPQQKQNTSVRVAQPAGGKSQIVFGDDSQKPTPVQKQQQQQPTNPPPQQQQQQQQQQTHTSVKVKNPPGGQSQITFG